MNSEELVLYSVSFVVLCLIVYDVYCVAFRKRENKND